jgi:DNA-binding protein H-NS
LTKTYADYLSDIERLKQKAEEARRKEVAGVVDRIKGAIAHYGLTAADLGLGDAPVAPASPVRKAAAVATKKAAAPAARYSDGQGNSWSGRGPKPGWVKAALAAGRSLEELGGGSDDGAVKPSAKKARPPAKKAASGVKFKDDAGHTWSGMGPKPKWLKEALDAGKTLEDLKA